MTIAIKPNQDIVGKFVAITGRGRRSPLPTMFSKTDMNQDTQEVEVETDLYPETQFLADLKRASAPMKRLADEAVAEHKAMKARLKAAKP